LAALSLCVICGGRAMGQTAAATARIETTALRLIEPDPYQVSAVLEPARRVKLVAPIDGLIRSVDARLGGTVRESQEVVQFDPTEANARLRVAEAEVKAKPTSGSTPVHPAEVEAAQARVEVARAQLALRSVRAPFAGRVLDVPVYPGQYVLKGTPLLELADTSSLRTILPVDRRIVSVGATITVSVEEQEVSGKVQAILPLPEAFGVLRELATPFAAAAVTFPNARGELDAGLRARPAGVPTTAIANIPKRAVRPDEVRGAAASMVQVIRNEYVTNIPVQVLGGLGPDRVQVSGLFRNTDALIIGSSVPLIPGTLVRFNEGPAARGIEATSPNPAHGGLDAGITPPGGGAPASSGRGAAGDTYRRGSRRPEATSPRSTNTPTQSQAGGAPPF
jgi:multidrug efflux pump subunit AcrA (membrane-fusion protein)